MWTKWIVEEVVVVVDVVEVVDDVDEVVDDEVVDEVVDVVVINSPDTSSCLPNGPETSTIESSVDWERVKFKISPGAIDDVSLVAETKVPLIYTCKSSADIVFCPLFFTLITFP